MAFFLCVLQQTFFPYRKRILRSYLHTGQVLTFFLSSLYAAKTEETSFQLRISSRTRNRWKNELQKIKIWWKMSVSTYLNSSLVEEQLKFWWTTFCKAIYCSWKLVSRIFLTFLLKRTFLFFAETLPDLIEMSINI